MLNRKIAVARTVYPSKTDWNENEIKSLTPNLLMIKVMEWKEELVKPFKLNDRQTAHKWHLNQFKHASI